MPRSQKLSTKGLYHRVKGTTKLSPLTTPLSAFAGGAMPATKSFLTTTASSTTSPALMHTPSASTARVTRAPVSTTTPSQSTAWFTDAPSEITHLAPAH